MYASGMRSPQQRSMASQQGMVSPQQQNLMQFKPYGGEHRSAQTTFHPTPIGAAEVQQAQYQQQMIKLQQQQAKLRKNKQASVNLGEIDNATEMAQWFVSGVSRSEVRSMAKEILERGQIGNFLVRDVQSNPGCYGLTVKAPTANNKGEIQNHLIEKVVSKRHQGTSGYRMRGAKETFSTISALVDYYSSVARQPLGFKLVPIDSNRPVHSKGVRKQPPTKREVAAWVRQASASPPPPPHQQQQQQQQQEQPQQQQQHHHQPQQQQQQQRQRQQQQQQHHQRRRQQQHHQRMSPNQIASDFRCQTSPTSQQKRQSKTHEHSLKKKGRQNERLHSSRSENKEQWDQVSVSPSRNRENEQSWDIVPPKPFQKKNTSQQTRASTSPTSPSSPSQTTPVGAVIYTIIFEADTAMEAHNLARFSLVLTGTDASLRLSFNQADRLNTQVNGGGIAILQFAQPELGELLDVCVHSTEGPPCVVRRLDISSDSGLRSKSSQGIEVTPGLKGAKTIQMMSSPKKQVSVSRVHYSTSHTPDNDDYIEVTPDEEDMNDLHMLDSLDVTPLRSADARKELKQLMSMHAIPINTQSRPEYSKLPPVIVAETIDTTITGRHVQRLASETVMSANVDERWLNDLGSEEIRILTDLVDTESRLDQLRDADVNAAIALTDLQRRIGEIERTRDDLEAAFQQSQAMFKQIELQKFEDTVTLQVTEAEVEQLEDDAKRTEAKMLEAQSRYQALKVEMSTSHEYVKQQEDCWQTLTTDEASARSQLLEFEDRLTKLLVEEQQLRSAQSTKEMMIASRVAADQLAAMERTQALREVARQHLDSQTSFNPTDFAEPAHVQNVLESDIVGIEGIINDSSFNISGSTRLAAAESQVRMLEEKLLLAQAHLNLAETTATLIEQYPNSSSALLSSMTEYENKLENMGPSEYYSEFDDHDDHGYNDQDDNNDHDYNNADDNDNDNDDLNTTTNQYTTTDARRTRGSLFSDSSEPSNELLGVDDDQHKRSRLVELYDLLVQYSGDVRVMHAKEILKTTNADREAFVKLDREYSDENDLTVSEFVEILMHTENNDSIVTTQRPPQPNSLKEHAEKSSEYGFQQQQPEPVESGERPLPWVKAGDDELGTMLWNPNPRATFSDSTDKDDDFGFPDEPEPERQIPGSKVQNVLKVWQLRESTAGPKARLSVELTKQLIKHQSN